MSTDISTVYALLLPNAITVKVRFADTVTNKTYTYKALTDWGIQVGDTVIVETPHGEFKVTTVTEVHDYLDIVSGVKLKWLVQRVDRSEYDKLNTKELEVAKHMQLREREEKRKKLFAELLGSYESENELRKALGLPLVRPIQDERNEAGQNPSTDYVIAPPGVFDANSFAVTENGGVEMRNAFVVGSVDVILPNDPESAE